MEESWDAPPRVRLFTLGQLPKLSGLMLNICQQKPYISSLLLHSRPVALCWGDRLQDFDILNSWCDQVGTGGVQAIQETCPQSGAVFM